MTPLRLFGFPLRTYRFSLRARVTSWYLGLLAVALAVFSIGIYIGMHTYLKQSLQRGLSGTARTIARDLLSKLGEKGDAWVLGEVRESYAASSTDHYIRLSSNGHVLYQTGDMVNPAIRIDVLGLPASAADEKFRQEFGDGQPVLTYSLPYLAGDGRVFLVEAGASLVPMQQTLHSLAKILVVASLLILLAAAVGGYLLMARPLRPLVALTEKAEGIGRKELGERLPVIPTGDELERLTHALNGMISRLETSLAHNYRFSADASHELRTPLTIMRGEIEELLQHEELTAQVVENLVSTLDEIDRMSRIVNSLMTITRLDAGGERMDMQVLDLAALARTTVENLRLLAEEKQLSLAYSGEGSVLISADPMRMRQVMVNLIDNAIKYTSAGTAGEVNVMIAAIGTHAYLRVADHGIGIPKEALGHVFDRFYRTDFARSRVAGGVGLGLAIVKAIVTAHDGAVSIESAMGKGSTVCVSLPLASAGAVAQPRVADTEQRYRWTEAEVVASHSSNQTTAQ